MVEATEEKPQEKPEETPAAERSGDDPAALRREAAKYRTRAKEADAKRDKLAERLQVAQRAEVTRLAAEHLTDGADLFRAEVELDTLLTDEGDVDPQKVSAAAADVVDRQPHWAKTKWAQGSADQGRGVGPKDDPPSFGSALKMA